MCGICGWLNIHKKIDYTIIEKMNNIVSYRGPDDEGYAFISNQGICHYKGKDTCDKNLPPISESKNEKQAFLALGHRRLSIVDLSVLGHQPMQTPDGSLCITYNGEIYNYIELRDELKQKGYTFRSECDTEVILHAYAEWGEKCVNHFNGMWAFGIWDGVHHKLFCSRDRLGAKPFYYYRNGDEFIFSSEIKQICENPSVKRILNESLFVTQIMWSISDFSEDTLIKDIKCIQGGYNLSIQLEEDNSSIKNFVKYQYWDIDTENKKDFGKEEVFKMLEDAIHIRTRSDVPIGVMLSGGLDSSCITAEISQYAKQAGIGEINTFTTCYNNFDEGDEKEFAHTVNSYCNTIEHLVYPDSQNALEDLSDMVWHAEGNADFGLGSYLMIKEVGKTGIKVLINGQGADETMFGYERYYAFYFAELLKKGHILQFITGFRKACRNSKLNFKMLVQYSMYFNIFGLRKKRCFFRMKDYVTEKVTNEYNRNNTVREHISCSSLQELSYKEIRGSQLSHILRMDDRLYMSQSLESRVPFIDYRYVEAAASIPANQKIQKGYTKYLLREHFDSKLPPEIIWRKNKMGWPSPKKRWVEGFDNEAIDDLFENARTKKYFNIENLKILYKKNPTAYPIEKFVTSELFVRRFDVEIP